MTEKKKLKISELFIYLSEDEEGEGVMAQTIGDYFAPLFGADQARIDSLRPMAANIAAKSKKRVLLCKFSNREDMETIEPKADDKPSITMEEIMAARDASWEAQEVKSEFETLVSGPHGVWLPVRDYWAIVAKDCIIYLQARPAHCDRGNWLAQIQAFGGLARELDYADLWPRYYMDRTRAEQEIRDWLIKRGQWDYEWETIKEP